MIPGRAEQNNKPETFSFHPLHKYTLLQVLPWRGTWKCKYCIRLRVLLMMARFSLFLTFLIRPYLLQWRSPEEYKDEALNEKIDVWSLGNNMYSILTGFVPFPWLNTDEMKVRKSSKSYLLAFLGDISISDNLYHLLNWNDLAIGKIGSDGIRRPTVLDSEQRRSQTCRNRQELLRLRPEYKAKRVRNCHRTTFGCNRKFGNQYYKSRSTSGSRGIGTWRTR